MVCRSMHLMGSDFTSPVQFDLTVGKVWQWQVLFCGPGLVLPHVTFIGGPKEWIEAFITQVLDKVLTSEYVGLFRRERENKRSFHLRYRLCLVALSCHTISIHSSGHCTYLTA